MAEININASNITHNNHYVPRFYLKNWSDDGKTIYTYSLLVANKDVPYWQRKSIKNVAVWYDLYTRRVNQQEIDDFEAWFDHEFESPAKPIFDKLLNNGKITKAESIIVSRFVAAQHIRTPAKLNEMLAWGKKEIPHVIESTLSKMNRELANGRIHRRMQPPTESDELLTIKINYDEEQALVHVNSVVGKSMYLYFVKHLLTNTVEYMHNHCWHVVHAAKGISFPTSDDPVICLNYRNENDYDFNGGWGLKHGIILMPISPDKLLFTQIGDKGPYDLLSCSPHWSSLFRKMIIQHAHRAVFADKPQKGMLAINPRIVNNALYYEEQQSIANWHENHMSAEEALMKK